MAFSLSGEEGAKRQRMAGMGEVSEENILALVAQRESLRQARRFAESDAIREQLRSMGVELYDNQKEWRCSDGRRGQLFTAGPGMCVLEDHDIQAQINQREEARKSKDWATADAVRDGLRQNGVELSDKENVWRTNNGRSGTYSGGVPVQAIAGLDENAIRKLVAERERLRAGMDFEAADELRRQLATMGVEVFDNDRIWRTNDGKQGVIITGGQEAACPLSDADIAYHVQMREDARHAKDFTQADMIRDNLRRQGVELLDTNKMWSTTDGRQGSYQGGLVQQQQMGQPMLNNMMAAAGGGGFAQPGMMHQPVLGAPRGTPSSLITQSPSAMTFCTASIVSMVSGRERARETHDWKAADEIRQDLRVHGVDVWDKEKMWRANDGRTGPLVRLA